MGRASSRLASSRARVWSRAASWAWVVFAVVVEFGEAFVAPGAYGGGVVGGVGGQGLDLG
jgi:hypothetical protein